jgi:hypothetical protein
MAESSLTQRPSQLRRQSTVRFDDEYVSGTPALRRPLLGEQESLDSYYVHYVRRFDDSRQLLQQYPTLRRQILDSRKSTPLADDRDIFTPLPQRAQLSRRSNQDAGYFPPLNPPPLYDRSLPPDLPCDFSDQLDRRGSLPSTFKTSEVPKWRNPPKRSSEMWNDDEDTAMGSSVSSLGSSDSDLKKPKVSKFMEGLNDGNNDLQLKIFPKVSEGNPRRSYSTSKIPTESHINSPNPLQNPRPEISPSSPPIRRPFTPYRGNAILNRNTPQNGRRICPLPRNNNSLLWEFRTPHIRMSFRQSLQRTRSRPGPEITHDLSNGYS